MSLFPPQIILSIMPFFPITAVEHSSGQEWMKWWHRIIRKSVSKNVGYQKYNKMGGWTEI